MSTVNVDGVVKSIRGTTPLTPLVEIVVNAIQAIEEADISDGKVAIRVIRGGQECTDGKHEIVGFEIEDNGIGFDQVHLNAFDELYTTCKAKSGGKGFGRFTTLKYFDDVTYASVFRDKDGLHEVSFRMGRKNSIIEDYVEPHSTTKTGTGTLVRLISRGENNKFGSVIDNIAEKLLEKLLPCFVDKEKTCPIISISEQDGFSTITLNDSVNSERSNNIKEIQRGSFQLRGRTQQEKFNVRVFKFYHPFVKHSSNNTLSLVAHGREVISDSLKEFIPEFQEEFQEVLGNNTRTFIVRAYVFGELLDRTVSLERCTFAFVDDNDLQYGISRKQIEIETANEVKRIMSDDINRRIEEKREKVNEYVNETAPWYKSIVNDVDFSCLPTHPSEDAIDRILHEHSYKRTKATSAKVASILKNSSLTNIQNDISTIISEIQKVNKDDLIQYVARRKAIISLFEKSLECDDKDQYVAENVLHDIIFPRHNTTDDLQYEKHNLWLIDERLNYSDYISSDVAINREDRPDMMVCYDGRISFREGNDKENPISIFEFKKPWRTDFISSKAKEDPIEQILRYVKSIKSGNVKLRNGREVCVSQTTPFYGYVICTLTSEVKSWLHDIKDFTPMPDEKGWFKPFVNNHLYMEILDWEKVLSDAKKHHRTFFRKLGVE